MTNSTKAAARGLLTALVAAGCAVTLLCGGCPDSGTMGDGDGDGQSGRGLLTVPPDASYEADDNAARDAESLLSELPAPDATFLVEQPAGDNWPKHAVFGAALSDFSELYVSATRAGEGVEFEGVSVVDFNGALVARQEVYDDGSRLTFGTGDAVDLVELGGGGYQVTWVLNATVPPSIVVAYVDSGGGVTIDQDASFFGDAVNADYGRKRIGARAPWPKGGLSASDALPQRTGINPPVPFNAADPCDKVLGSLIASAEIACGLKDIATKALPKKVVQGIAFGATQALDLAKGQTDEGIRVVSAIKGGIGVLAKALEYGIEGVDALTPWGLACFGINMLEEGVQIGTGQTIAENICDNFQDADNDGIDDSDDICPDTPAGEQADQQGCSECQRDFDGDGVLDCEDLCPSLKDATNADSDGDGVGDICDVCDGTPAGATVDDVGCTASQQIADDDHDGIPNDIDLCPHTADPDNADPDNDRLANPCDNCDTVYNPNQEDVNNDGVGDACDGDFTVIWTTRSTGTPESANITLSGNPRAPTISFNYANTHSAWLAGGPGNEVLWGFAAYQEVCLGEFCYPEETAIASPLVYGQYKTYADPFDNLPTPTPALEKGQTYTAVVVFWFGEDQPQEQVSVIFQVND